jgi:hypothetical protein
VLVLAALRRDLDVVVAAVGVDFRGVVGGSPEGSLLHHAAWVGSPALAGRLLELGADPAGGAGSGDGTPLAWAAHGSSAHRLAGRDYAAVAEQLAEAGNPVEPGLLDAANGPLVAWLEERL